MMRLEQPGPLKITFISVLFLLILPAISCAGQFKVTRVLDGDTFAAEGFDIEIMVRLAGIDAPEPGGQLHALKAQEYLAGMILDKIVKIRGWGIGPMNHVIGVVYVGGTNVNIEMVRAGLAIAYRGRTPKGFDSTPYLEAENEARNAKRGIWSPEI